MPAERNGMLLVLMQPPAAMEKNSRPGTTLSISPNEPEFPALKLRYVMWPYRDTRASWPFTTSTISRYSTRPNMPPSQVQIFSPWTKRVTSRVQIYRIVAEQIFPGDAITQRSSRIVLIRLRTVRTPR